MNDWPKEQPSNSEAIGKNETNKIAKEISQKERKDNKSNALAFKTQKEG